MKKLLAILLTLTLALGMMIPIMADPTPAQSIVGYSPTVSPRSPIGLRSLTFLNMTTTLTEILPRLRFLMQKA